MRRVCAAMLVVCACLLIVGCGTPVPGVKGKALGQASAAIEGAGFKIGRVTYDPRSTEATGSILSQTPEAGSRSAAGTIVALVIAGPPPVPVPSLAGLDRARIDAALTDAGLALGTVTESYNASIPAGGVVSQRPTSGTSLDKGLGVAVVISKGPEPVPVPSVVGRPQAEAVATLKSAGFAAAASAKNDKAAKGTVIAQQPNGGQAQPGTTVVLTVSSGIEMVKVPSWKSFPGAYNGADWNRVLASAEAAVKAGFKARGLVAVVEFVPGDASNGSQSPRAGAMVPRGTRVYAEIPVFD